MPAVPASQEMVIDLVMVTWVIPPDPKLPASRQLTSPPATAAAIAALKVRHGAVRLQGLASSPVLETQVRASRACAGEAARNGNASAMMADESTPLRMRALLC